MIEAENLKRSFGPVSALSGVSFEVAEGEIFGIIGPDGAGKTTLFRILNTLLLPDEGRASVDGLDVVSDYAKIRERVGYMPGRFSLYQDLSVEENLNFFASVFGVSPEDNYRLIEHIYVQIEPFKKRRAGALSGGMKQKLALCCALIHEPRVLFLDEPTTGVDPVSRKEFWEMLKHLKERGMTILVSTPYMDEASLCDRIALVKDGRFLAIDAPAAVAASFPAPLFAVRSGRMYDLLKALRASAEVRSSFAFGDFHHVSLRDPSVDAGALALHLGALGFGDVEAIPIQPSVEDRFMDFSLREASA